MVLAHAVAPASLAHCASAGRRANSTTEGPLALALAPLARVAGAVRAAVLCRQLGRARAYGYVVMPPMLLKPLLLSWGRGVAVIIVCWRGDCCSCWRAKHCAMLLPPCRRSSAHGCSRGLCSLSAVGNQSHRRRRVQAHMAGGAACRPAPLQRRLGSCWAAASGPAACAPTPPWAARPSRPPPRRRPPSRRTCRPRAGGSRHCGSPRSADSDSAAG